MKIGILALQSLAVLLLSLQSRASSFQLEKYGLGYGILNSGLFTESIDEGNNTSFYGSFTFHFLTGQIQWTRGPYKYGVKAGYTLIPREAKDKAADISHWLLSPYMGLALDNEKKWLWTFGLGLQVTSSQGKGGQTVLNNGESTSTFFLPSNSSQSLVLNLETGLTYPVAQNVYLSGTLLLNGLLSLKRNASLFININYLWGQSSTGLPSRRRGSRNVRRR